jgi:hypothetical protein
MKLSDRIWITRKSRIYTEQRLLRKNLISQILITFYSSLLVFLTIWNLKYPNDQINLFLVIGSIAVLVSSITISSQKYLERSIAIRNCYIKLDELFHKVVLAEKNKNDDLIQQFESEYTANLLNVENHSDYDYLCLRFNLRYNTDTTLPPFTLSDYAQYILEKGWRIIVVFLYFILPFAIALLWALYRNVSSN